MPRPATCDYDAVRRLFVAGMAVSAIAQQAGVGERRVQQLVADLRPAAHALEPEDPELEVMMHIMRRQLGPNYGTAMMEGALRAAYPARTEPTCPCLLAFRERRERQSRLVNRHQDRMADSPVQIQAGPAMSTKTGLRSHLRRVPSPESRVLSPKLTKS